jgi:trimeric autotransporter adhesin
MIRRCLLLWLVSTSIATTSLAAVFTVTTAADSGPGSLRQAILDANANPGADAIHFSIGTGPQVIAPVTPLPAVTDAVTIDGTTQPGFAGTPIVTLDGNGIGGHGLTINAGPSTVRGLVIVDFGGAGIAIRSNGSTIIGNYIGVDASGAVAVPNGDSGVDITGGDDNRVGGTAPGEGNVISGNGRSGVGVRPFSTADDATGNVVQGNFIGTNAAGTAAIPNVAEGVSVAGAKFTTVGGTAPGARNVISGNGSAGVGVTGVCFFALPFTCVASEDTVIAGNFIGTNAAGTQDLGNRDFGIDVLGAPRTTIGGDTAGRGNVISGNDDGGIRIGSTSGVGGPDLLSTGTIITGNLIGTNAAGTAAIANGGDGMILVDVQNTTIGGSGAARNVISGNTQDGIQLADGGLAAVTTGNVVRGNLIGTAIDGSGALPNGGNGIVLSSSIPAGLSGNVIGGTAAGEGNTIRFNSADGIRAGGGSGNQFLGNSIDQNGLLGIDLNGDGVTPNDLLDADAGPNDLQNFPILTNAVITATTSVTGTLNSTPNRTFRIELFNSPAADPSGFGEGRVLLGFTQVTTDGAGNAAIAATLPAVAVGSVVTATATDLTSLNTSEFSNAVAAGLPPTLNIGDTTVVEGDSGTVDAVFTVSLTAVSDTDVTFQFATADGTATAPGDYTATNGTGVIPAGSLSTTITVPVIGDGTVETDEIFFVNVSSVSGATAGDLQGQATIVTDDQIVAAGIPTLSEWGMILMAVFLALAGAVAMRPSS